MWSDVKKLVAPVIVGICIAVIFVAGLGVYLKASNWRDQARAYCERHGAVLVLEYCLTEVEMVLRRVPYAR